MIPRLQEPVLFADKRGLEIVGESDICVARESTGTRKHGRKKKESWGLCQVDSSVSITSLDYRLKGDFDVERGGRYL